MQISAANFLIAAQSAAKPVARPADAFVASLASFEPSEAKQEPAPATQAPPQATKPLGSLVDIRV